ncbi:MAG: NADH-quinone oxidoreductase subunit C [Thermodesulfovibrionales bacterium]|nr:NADH-quinone oxidoreductase subunit C [Thermodesulfovibrionales bacterium]
MEQIQIAERLKEKFPEDVLSVSEFRGQVSVTVRKGNVLAIFRYLHDNPETDFDYLQDLCGVDYPSRKPRFEVVYHLYSINHRHSIRLKALVPEEDCSIGSVVPVWIGANWHERECFDMFGVAFKGHPDLRRILMPDDWEGHPLRKDYPLKGPEPENDWKGFREVLEDSERLKGFEWER